MEDDNNTASKLMNDEIWVDIQGYEDKYQISNKGRVKSLYLINRQGKMPREKILSYGYNLQGYPFVRLSKNGKSSKNLSIHRLVAKHFIENKNNYPCVNHIDSNRKNNDVSNLEFCTHKQNTQWALKTGRFDNMKKLNSERMKEREVWKGRWCKNA